jgi:hypothetical protein
MNIIAKCPGCNKSWLLDGSAVDRRIKCGNCKRLFKVPKLEEMPKAIEAINNSKDTFHVDESGVIYG